MKVTTQIFLIAFCSLFFACDSSRNLEPRAKLAGLKTKISITGSSTIAPVINDLSKLYEAKNKSIQIDVQSGGSSRGINDTRSGIAKIGMVSRDLKAEEADLSYFTLARDGLCLIVNSQNKIKELTEEQIVKIYQKKITNWKELGGEDRKIVVVGKAEGRSTLELLLSYFKLKVEELQPDVIIGDNEQGIKTIAGNPDSIGYVSIGAAVLSKESGQAIRALPLNGIEATLANVDNNTFPIKRNLNLVFVGKADSELEEFFNFLKTQTATEISKSHYFVPIF